MARNYQPTFKTNRINVPVYERVKYLYALGYTDGHIAKMINSEFDDIELYSMNPEIIRMLRSENKEDFDNTKNELATRCRESILETAGVLYNVTSDKEMKMARVYAMQLDKILDALGDLDINEIDEDTGSYKNTSRFFVLMEMAEKLQTKAAKLTGTEAIREIEAYRMKMQAKVQAEDSRGAGLVPSVGKTVDESGKVINDAPVTKFL